MPQLDWKGLTGDIVGQLAGYSRITKFAKDINIDENIVIPCLILYPTLSALADNFQFNVNTPLIEQADKSKGLIKFYKLPVPLPKLKTK